MYKILIIEDDIITLEIIANLLKNDYEVLVAKNGITGFEVYKKLKPDIIICDINIPNLNGIDLIKKIRLEDQNCKIIIMSVKDDIDTLLEATQLKLNKYLVKPFESEHLFEAINESINELDKFNTIAIKNIKISDSCIWKKDQFELFFNDEIVKLSPKEKKVINCLLENPNNIKSYDNIILSVWDGLNEVGDKNSLKTLMTTLRKKTPFLNIENIYGFGYKIVI